ncbi:MAG TPA: sulfatase-like hydrolase/transferase, partial [Chitinophagaceae bacterium]
VDVPKDSLSKYGFENAAELNAFRYTDFCFQKFMDAAAKEKYFSNTLFVFIGDHGIPGNAGNMFSDAWTKQRLTSEHVPLLFYGPELFGPQRINRIASQIDVLPTIAGLCGISYTNTALGRDLLDSAFFNRQLAFIVDPDNAMTGVVNDSIYYRHQIRSFKNEIVSIIHNRPVSDSNTAYLRQLTEAMFETSKYLLLNNKKK